MFHTSDQIDQVFHTLLQIIGPSQDVISISTPHPRSMSPAPHPVPSKSFNKVLAVINRPFASSLASRQFGSPNGWVVSSNLASSCESPNFQWSTILSASQIAHSFHPQIKSIPHPVPTPVPREDLTKISNQRC